MKEKFIFFQLIIFILAIIISAFHFRCDHCLYRNLQVKKNGYVLILHPGTPAYKIVYQLYHDGLLQTPIYFLIWLYLEGAWSQLKAGEYLIKPNTTLKDFIAQLRTGAVIQYALTIVPGWNFEKLITEIHHFPKLCHTLIGLSPAEIMARLGHPGEHPEGRFFPETYYFPAGTLDIDFLQRAYRLLQSKLQYWWDRKAASLPLQSAYEALILASIIEKESNISEEYNKISGVYIKRLTQFIPLQADPTVIYGLGDEFIGKLNYQLLKKPNPYNTYQYLGLPPTPIALPSEKAIQAAVHPKLDKNLYFVANSNGKGHIFSKTLAEHRVAAVKYKKRLLRNK